jgi:hypothetical protein
MINKRNSEPYVQVKVTGQWEILPIRKYLAISLTSQAPDPSDNDKSFPIELKIHQNWAIDVRRLTAPKRPNNSEKLPVVCKMLGSITRPVMCNLDKISLAA